MSSIERSYIQFINLLKMNFIGFRKQHHISMELFNGGVKEAIAEAKAKKTVFVVIVTGH